MSSVSFEWVAIILITIFVVFSFYVSSRGNHSTGQATMSRTDVNSLLDPHIRRMEMELEASKADCAKRIEELERRVEFLLSVIMASDKPMSMSFPERGYGLVLVMSNESVYSSAIKLSGIPVSIVDVTDLASMLSMIPRDSSRGDYGVVLAVVDDWSSRPEEAIERVGDVSNRVFIIVGRDSDRVAAFLGARSRGAVAVNASALIASQDEKTGGTRRDSVIEGNIAAFCAAFVVGIVKDGVDVDRAYERAKSGASGWVADRARLYR